jgi:hypothetical protein
LSDRVSSRAQQCPHFDFELNRGARVVIADERISVRDAMRGALIIMLAVVGLLVWDRQVNNSRYTDITIKLAMDIKRGFLGH